MLKTTSIKKTSHVSLIAIAVVFGLALSLFLETGRSRAADSPDSVSQDSAPAKAYRCKSERFRKIASADIPSSTSAGTTTAGAAR